MKRLLPLLALGLLAGCATYSDYGYYDDGRGYHRGYDAYDDGGYYSDGYERGDGGDYYYSNQPDRYYGSYGSGSYYPYSYGGYGGYGGYGYGGGYGYRPSFGLGLGFSSGSRYPYYGGYGSYYPYSGYGGYYGSGRNYRYDRNDLRRGDRRGDGVIDDDASNLANQIARERGVRDAQSPSGNLRGGTRSYGTTPADRAARPYSRERDIGGWRSDYRDAQLAAPRDSAADSAYSRGSSGAPQLRMDPAQPARTWDRQPRSSDQAMPRTRPIETWRSAPTGVSRGVEPRFDASRGRSVGNATDRAQYAAPRVKYVQGSSSAPAPRENSRGSGAPDRSYSRERDDTETP